MAVLASEAVSTTEPQARIAPALSATSDAPIIATESVVDAATAILAAIETKPAAVAATEADKPADVADEADDTADADATDPKPPKKELEPWAKREITKARNQKRDAEAAKLAAETRANNAEANLKRALEAVEKLTGDSAVAARKDADAADPRPKRETFDNPDAYDSALVEWAGRRAAVSATAAAELAAAEATKKSETETAQKATDERNRETIKTWNKRKDAFTEEHPDYADVAEADDLKISIPMAQAILEDDDGPAIAYYLGQNPDEAERISALSPARAVSELGRIAARLTAKPVVSTKPAPIKPLNTGTSPATRKSADQESMEEYAARRTAEMRGRTNGAGATH